ncbi:unnamed protein product [Boreogadus saida]
MGVQGEPHAGSPVGVSAGPAPPCPGEGLLWEAVEDDGAGESPPFPSPLTKQIVLQSWAVSDGDSECLMERGAVRGGVGASQPITDVAQPQRTEAAASSTSYVLSV